MYRQGDVLVLSTNEKIPAGLKEIEREDGAAVLAHGEATGHKHQIKERHATLFDGGGAGGVGGVAWLALDADAKLVHEEHSTIDLPAGSYKVIRQREYHPVELRNVAD